MTNHTIVNLTSCDASVDLADGRTLGLPRLLDDAGSARAARAVRVPCPDDPVDLGWTRVPTSTSRLMGTSGLPDPAAGTWLLVSEAVAEAAYHSGRDCSDLLVLDSEASDDARGRTAIRRTLRRWTPTCSLRVHLDDLRRAAATLTEGESGYAALAQSMDDRVTRLVSEVASCLLASMAPAPGDPSTYARRALAIAVDLLRISQEREDARRRSPGLAIGGDVRPGVEGAARARHQEH